MLVRGAAQAAARFPERAPGGGNSIWPHPGPGAHLERTAGGFRVDNVGVAGSVCRACAGDARGAEKRDGRGLGGEILEACFFKGSKVFFKAT